MNKLSKDFFSEGEVILVGYSSEANGFSRLVYSALIGGGVKVYPVNKRTDANFDIKVYKNLDEMPKIPKAAYVLTGKSGLKAAVTELAAKGVKKVLFQSGKSIDPDILAECTKNGIEVSAGCPMMIYGKGLHKFHAFFAGVK